MNVHHTRRLSLFLLLCFVIVVGLAGYSAEPSKLSGRWKLQQRTIDGEEMKLVAQNPGPTFAMDTILKIDATNNAIKIRRSAVFSQKAQQRLGNNLAEYASEFTYRTDKTVKVSPFGVAEFDATARWMGNDLIVTLAKAGRPVFVERWQVSGNQLFVTQTSGADIDACTVASAGNEPKAAPASRGKAQDCTSNSERVENFERLR